jgi:undecaprenyl-diphosphatase
VELAVMLLLRDGQVYAWEVRLTRWLQDVPAAEEVFRSSSTLTNTLSVPFAVLFVAVLALVWATGRRLEVALLALSFPLHVLAQFPKALIDRPRPSAEFEGVEGVGGLQSFPSGHAEYVITFYGFLAFILLVRFRGAFQRTVIVSGWLLFVLATGFGRVAAGRHWPLDIVTSYVVGVGLLSGLVWLYFAFRPVNPESSASPVARA